MIQPLAARCGISDSHSTQPSVKLLPSRMAPDPPAESDMDTDLKRVYDLLVPPDYCLHWSAKSPEHRSMVGAYVCDVAGLHRVVKQQEGWDFFVSLNPSHHARVKPGKEQMKVLSCIGIDIDPFPQQRLDIRGISDEMVRLVRLINGGDSSCCTIVHSGRGMWLWLFVEPTPIDEEFTADDADTVVKAVTHFVINSSGKLRASGIIDTASAEVSRIARCPGTINHKTGKKAYILLDHEPVSRIKPSQLTSIINVYKDRYANALTPKDFDLTDTSIMTIASAANMTSRNFILCGVDHALESRHTRMFSTAKNLKEIGVAKTDAAAILALGASRCRPNLLLTDPSFLDVILKQVWRK